MHGLSWKEANAAFKAVLIYEVVPEGGGRRGGRITSRCMDSAEWKEANAAFKAASADV